MTDPTIHVPVLMDEVLEWAFRNLSDLGLGVVLLLTGELIRAGESVTEYDIQQLCGQVFTAPAVRQDFTVGRRFAFHPAPSRAARLNPELEVLEIARLHAAPVAELGGGFSRRRARP